MIRVFPDTKKRNKWLPTDKLAFRGDPPLWRPQDRATPVCVSVAFTWDRAEGERLADSWSRYYDNVKLGGPAFDDEGGEFVPGRFIKQGVTITSRGCPKSCPWCFVPKREGKVRELKIQDGYIVQDNNLLACSLKHIEAVMDMLREQPKAAIFSGGLDAKLFTKAHRDMLLTIRFKELWFACDSRAGLDALRNAAALLAGVKENKKRCYVMIGFNGETLGDAERRLQEVYRMGFLPFCQLYQREDRIDWPKEWRELRRKWSRPAAYRSA